MELAATITFLNSKAKTFGRAIRLAGEFPGLQRSQGTHTPNVLTLTDEDFRLRLPQIESLWETVSDWKGSVLLVNGKEVAPDEFRKFTRVIRCCRECHRAPDQEVHCYPHGRRSGWGCRFLHSVSLRAPMNAYEENNEKYWYHIGAFTSEGVWRIDKPQLLARLKREADIEYLHLCDVFKTGIVEEAIKSLPDVIDLSKDKDWAPVSEIIQEGATMQRCNIRVAPHYIQRADVDGFSMSSQEPLRGSKPNDGAGRNIPAVRFADIGGIDGILDTIREVVELPLKHPDIFGRLGIAPHRGVLLYGPPGCGKTLVAKAIANEVQAHFIDVAGPEMVSKWLGQSEANLRAAFEEASRLEPSIIFFDEIDSIAQSRSSDESSRHYNALVNQLLTLMDGVRKLGRVCVIASTNRPELLDSALLRPGRFDLKIEVPKPDVGGCVQILRAASKDIPFATDVDLGTYGRQLVGFSGAEIAFVAREAAYCCMRRNLDIPNLLTDPTKLPLLEGLSVSNQDLREAISATKEQRSVSDSTSYSDPDAD